MTTPEEFATIVNEATEEILTPAFENIVRRLDGSYVIDKNGYPFHVPNEGEWQSLWAEVDEYAALNPGEVTEEVPPPPQPPVPLETVVAEKLAEIMKGYAAAFAPVEAVYPLQEREGWAIQEAEARAALTDPEAETPVLSALVQLRAKGETVTDLAGKVMQNSAQWRMVYAYLTGQQQRMYGEVMALAEQDGVTNEDIAAYPVQYWMPEGL